MDAGQLGQAFVGLAAILISLFTFLNSSNDRRTRGDREELQEMRERIERLTRERDEFERKYFGILEENSALRREHQ